MVKKTLLLLMVFVLLMGTNYTVSSAKIHERISLEENKLNDNYGDFSNKQDVINYLLEKKVPIDKIDGLMYKLDNNIPWDCMLKEKTDIIPEEFYEFDVNTIEKQKYFRFNDGSFINILVGGGEEIKNYRPKFEYNSSKSIVSDSFGTLYKNHKVYKSIGLTNAYFYANFYVARTGASTIYTYDNSDGMYNSPYGEVVGGFGVTENPNKEMIRDVEYNGQAALFRMYWFNQIEVSSEWSVGIGSVGGSAPIGSTCNLYLALIKNKMYVDSKLPF